MKIIAGITILAVLPCAAWASPQQDADGIVTIKRKGATWSFKVLPEGRKKAVVEENVVEFDVPQRLFAAWAVEEPIPGPGSNPFQNPFESSGTTVLFFREGKRYPDYQGEPADLKAQTAQHLADLQRSMIEGFYQFDFDFPGGTWEELARLLRDRLAAAYEQQFPEILKPFLPAKVDIDISSQKAHYARYPAIQAKSVSLAMLRLFGPGPLVEAKVDSMPRLVRQEDQSLTFVMDTTPSTRQFVLKDGNALDTLDVSFFHLGAKPALPGADHVVALFEMAWKARGKPIFAKVKYHPETRTLMVQGTYEELQSADKVFATLTGRPAPVEPSANPFDTITETLQKIAELIEKQTAEKDQ
jgi:hypothetical protein